MSKSVHGKGQARRAAVHKAARSPSTLQWEREFLAPERPVWMAQSTYEALLEIRRQVGVA